MDLTIRPGNPLSGEIELPGDKSISHRAALFAALANGNSKIENFLRSGVTDVMLKILGQLGVDWHISDNTLYISGKGLTGLNQPSEILDCGNSGTTMRLLAGALAAANLTATLDGTAGLRRRPMNRIVHPLQEMGAQITSTNDGTAPLKLTSRRSRSKLQGIKHILPVASAQVKTAILLAGLMADNASTILEPEQSRDHTERMLAGMGASIESSFVDGFNRIILQPLQEKDLSPLDLRIPGDISSAAFLIVGALITPGSEILIRNVGLNPTRTGLIDVLKEMGANISISEIKHQHNELVGDIFVTASRLEGIAVSGSKVTSMIDEFPIFAIAAAYAHGKTEITNAHELRLKESDRIANIVAMLQTLGVQIEEFEDGFTVQGNGLPNGGMIRANQDHRLAMSMAICSLAAKQQVTIQNAEIYQESFPGFPEALSSLGANIQDD